MPWRNESSGVHRSMGRPCECELTAFHRERWSKWVLRSRSTHRRWLPPKEDRELRQPSTLTRGMMALAEH